MCIRDSFEALPGRGVKGNIDGTNYFIGNRKLIADQQLHLPQSVEDRVSQLEIQGKTVMILADEKSVLGAVSVADIAKETSKKAIEKLKERDLDLVMITGDNQNTAQAIAQEVGISKTLAEVLPEDKSQQIAQLQKTGKKVAMVGDGTVSYTHLDVYKRQINDNPKRSSSKLDQQRVTLSLIHI